MITLELPQTPEENLALGQWVMQRIPDSYYTNFSTMAFFEPGKGILGVVLYHSYRQTDIEIVFAGDGKRWANRKVISQALGWPFEIGCHRITAVIRKDNKPSRKLVQQLGFRQEGKLRRAAKDGSDLFIYGLLPTDYRIGVKTHGKVHPKSAAAA